MASLEQFSHHSFCYQPRCWELRIRRLYSDPNSELHILSTYCFDCIIYQNHSSTSCSSLRQILLRVLLERCSLSKPVTSHLASDMPHAMANSTQTFLRSSNMYPRPSRDQFFLVSRFSASVCVPLPSTTIKADSYRSKSPAKHSIPQY